MKPVLFALVSLVVGIAIGLVLARQEFARDRLPIDLLDATGSQVVAASAKAVVVGSDTHRFGTMHRGTTESHTFKIRNAGAGPLTLQKGNSSCKCTLFELENGSLPPGETASIKLEWKPVTTDSAFNQTAEVITNDPTNLVITFTISGKVIDLVQPESKEITFSDLSANEAAHGRLRIFGFRSPELTVTKHEWGRPDGVDHFQVSFEPLTSQEIEQEGATAGVAVLLDVSPGLPLGPLSNALRLTLSEPGVEPLEIRVAGSVSSDISLSGPSTVPDKLLVNLGVISQAAGKKTTVYLLSKGPFRDQTALTLGKVQPSTEFAVTLGEPLRNNPKVLRYPLTIEVPPQSTPVAHKGEGSYATIQVLATHPQVPELTVKVRYVVKED